MRCRCGHKASKHDDRFGCAAEPCLNLCVAYVPVRLPEPNEPIVFGVHRLDPDEAWTPEPLSEYWDQSERWLP